MQYIPLGCSGAEVKVWDLKAKYSTQVPMIQTNLRDETWKHGFCLVYSKFPTMSLCTFYSASDVPLNSVHLLGH